MVDLIMVTVFASLIIFFMLKYILSLRRKIKKLNRELKDLEESIPKSLHMLNKQKRAAKEKSDVD